MDQRLFYPFLIRRPYYVPGNPIQELVSSVAVRAFFFILVHIPLAFAFKWNSTIATLHAIATITVGLWWLAHDKFPDRLIYLVSYITGCELLWRGMNAFVFYEFGKYSVSFLLGIAILKYRRLSIADKRPLPYFALLLPSILVIPVFDRQAIASALMGPFSLALTTMFFSTVKINRDQLKHIFLMVLAPVTGLVSVASYFTSLYEETIEFGMGSLFATSADIGPNQVSSILGLGALMAFLYMFLERRHKALRFLMVPLMIWFLAQAALTFSRGGVWTAIGAIGVFVFYGIRNKHFRNLSVLVLVVISLLGNFYVFPALDDFTGGTLSDRFGNFDATGREKIIQSDLQIFREHPLMGVGPNQSKPHHALFFRYSSSHTEYTRLLAEHGSLGLIAMLILLWMVVENFFSKKVSPDQACRIAFITWSLLFMLHSATRLVAPSLMFGLGFATFLFEDNIRRR